MNILHINTYDNIGGAARAVFRLHKGLLSQGQRSTVFVANKKAHDSTVSAFIPLMNFQSRIISYFRYKKIIRDFHQYKNCLPESYEHFSDDRTPHGITLVSQLPSCDIINLHWISDFIDYQSFFHQIPKHIPIVWTLHDMNAFTGGCHYDNKCGKYSNRCGACPQLGSDNQKDLSNQIWKRKQDIFRKINSNQLHIITPSQWLANDCKHSPLLDRFSVSVIPNGLNTDDFAPRDRKFARALLDIPQNAKVVFFSASSLKFPRKGFSLLIKALLDADDLKNLFLVSIGRGKPSLETQIRHLHFGHIDNDRLLSLFYSAADLFIIPSLQDNLPNTVLESLACGTPVVGFDVGGIPDMVRSGVTGLLAPQRDVKALRTAITQILNNPDKLTEFSVNSRRIAVEEYSLEIQARNYSDLYSQLINTSDFNTVTPS